MVFHRSAAHGQAMISAQQTDRLGRKRAGVLDRLGFVENAVVEAEIFELQCIAPQRAVSRNHHVILVEMLPGFEACYSGVVKYSQFWREPAGLRLPMKN